MAKQREPERPQRVFDRCPHCGRPLSPWEKVLLSVDRALTCKHCWYRILLTVTPGDPEKPAAGDESKPKDG